jgi:hypothetical protein
MVELLSTEQWPSLARLVCEISLLMGDVPFFVVVVEEKKVLSSQPNILDVRTLGWSVVGVEIRYIGIRLNSPKNR